MTKFAWEGEMRIILAAGLALSWGGLAFAQSTQSPPVPTACEAASVQATYNQAVSAFSGQNGAAKDLVKAKALLDGIVSACGSTSVTFTPRVLRADIALQEKDNDTAFAALSPVPRPGRGAVGIHANFMMLKLLAARNDTAAFAAERSALLNASGHLLTAAPVNGLLVENFTSPGGDKVAAFRLELTQGSFIRHYEFLIEPAGALAMPMSMSLSTDSIDLKLPGMENTKVYFLDRYVCAGHDTMQQFMTQGPAPEYQLLKDRVLAALAGTIRPVSGTVPPASTGCAFESYITPGL